MCEHFVGLVEVDPVTDVCDECVAVGDRWVHLRACLVCGNVGCCDASKNRHARGHWQQTDHAVIKTIEPGESWKYCFADGLVTQ
ncbi:MAG: UBP-type zinc finger domain-containing protein [Acidimicrobiia bacterium]